MFCIPLRNCTTIYRRWVSAVEFLYHIEQRIVNRLFDGGKIKTISLSTRKASDNDIHNFNRDRKRIEWTSERDHNYENSLQI